MKSHPLVLDGLWQCLCPRFYIPHLRQSQYVLSNRATSAGIEARRKSLSKENSAPFKSWTFLSARTYSSLRAPTDAEPNTDSQPFSSVSSTTGEEAHSDYFGDNSRHRDASHGSTNSRLVLKTLTKDSPLRTLLNRTQLPEVSTSDLYVVLKTCAIRGFKREVDLIARTLVLERKEKPNLKLYTALIASNVNQALGSADEVAVLLKELSNHGMFADSGVYHSVLRVLAVHPNALLRGQIIHDMRGSWLSLTESGWHDVVAGCLKEGQMEQALQYLEEMQQSNIRIQAWLYQMVIYKLCDLNEIAGALYYLKETVSTGVQNMSSSVWYYVYDKACMNLHYDSVQFIWNRRVQLRHLTPSITQCTMSLITAARNGDAQLANDVFRVLTQRANVIESQHYEALMEAYIAANDLKTAITILCIMGRSGVEANVRNTQPIHFFVSQEPERAREMFDVLRELHKSERDIPVAAFNCLLESSTGQLPLDEIVDQYKTLHKLCSSGPNVHTFNALFRACRLENRKDTAMFFAAEMVHLGVKPGPLTYDRLILVCMTDGTLDDAFRYLEEMRGAGLTPRMGTLSAMVKAFCEASDSRAWSALRIMEESHGEAATAKTKAWMDSHWQQPMDSMRLEPTERHDTTEIAHMHG